MSRDNEHKFITHADDTTSGRLLVQNVCHSALTPSQTMSLRLALPLLFNCLFVWNKVDRLTVSNYEIFSLKKNSLVNL